MTNPPAGVAGGGGARTGLRSRRRSVLGAGLAVAAWALLAGHTPYRQWGVYRQQHLMILTSRADPPSFPLGQALAALLDSELPESAARVARAPDMERVGSLLSSGQFAFALMAGDLAAALFRGEPPFASFGPVALRALFGLGDYLLVARADVPDHHAWLICRALAERGDTLPATPTRPAAEPVPPHPGALAFYRGEDMPPPPSAE